MGRARPEDASPHRDSLVQSDIRRQADHLDGRPAASAGVRAAFVDGILDRPIRRQRTGSPDHPSEARLVSAERYTGERFKRRSSSSCSATAIAHAHGGPSRIRSIWEPLVTTTDFYRQPLIIRTGCFRATTASRSSSGRLMTCRSICSVRTRSSRVPTSTSSRRRDISVRPRASSPRIVVHAWPPRRTTRRSSVRHAVRRRRARLCPRNRPTVRSTSSRCAVTSTCSW